MATFSVITAREAPPKPKGSSRLAHRMREFNSYIGDVPKGEVGVLVPDEDETARGIAMRLRRAAVRVGKKVETWAVDSQVYFKVQK